MVDFFRGMKDGTNALRGAAQMKQQDDQRRFSNALATNQDQRATEAQDFNQGMQRRQYRRASAGQDFNQGMATNADKRAKSASEQNTKLHNLTMGIKKLEAFGKVMGGVTNDAQYQQAKQYVSQNIDPEMAGKMSPTFDPKLHITGKQKLEAELHNLKKLHLQAQIATAKGKGQPNTAERKNQQAISKQHLMGAAQQNGINISEDINGNVTGSVTQEQLGQLQQTAAQLGLKVYARRGELVDRDGIGTGDDQMFDVVGLVPNDSDLVQEAGKPAKTPQDFVNKYLGNGKVEAATTQPAKKPKKKSPKKKKKSRTPLIVREDNKESRYEKIKRGVGYVKDDFVNTLSPKKKDRILANRKKRENQALKMAGK